MKWRIFLVWLVLMTMPASAAERACIVPGQGYFRIHVGTAGLFGAFAHDHSIEAKKVVGCASIASKALERSSVLLEFPAAAIRVIDPKQSKNYRCEVQKSLQRGVRRGSESPRATF